MVTMVVMLVVIVLAGWLDSRVDWQAADPDASGGRR